MTGAQKRRGGRLRAFAARYRGQPLGVAGLVVLALVSLTALFADLLASDKPIACHLDGELYVLPAIVEPAALADHDNRTVLEAIAARGGWALLPPIPYGPDQTKVAGRVGWLSAPDDAHLLGTDDSGRDVLSRIVHGTRSALVVGFGSMAVCVLVGVLLGALAAYFGGRLDRIVLLAIETFNAFPTFFLILALQGLLGTGSLLQLVIVVGATRWTDVARVTRAEVMRTVNEDYVLAARALGLGNLRILARHVLPAAIGPVLVASTFGVAGAILIESTLSFLGYGAPPPTASLGQLITDAFLSEGCYWLAIFPGLVLFATIISVNLVGEALRDALDPAR